MFEAEAWQKTNKQNILLEIFKKGEVIPEVYQTE